MKFILLFLPLFAEAASFDFALLEKLPAGTNRVYSPYSVATAVEMALVGAKGETRAELLKALGVGDDYLVKARATHKALASAKDVKLNIANRFWGRKDRKYETDYLNSLKENFSSELIPTQFAGREEAARKEINKWIAKQTENKIKDLIPHGAVTSETDLVITNAIYFLGKWQKEFEPEATRKGDFKGASGKLTAEYMHNTRRAGYSENSDFQALELDYRGGEFSFVAILPKGKKMVNGATAEKLIANLENTEVAVSFPKFHVNKMVSLRSALSALGVKKAFSGDADFSGIRKATPAEPGVQISEVFHQADFLLDEQGTEAAAATALMMVVGSAMPRDPKVFKADHPFTYLIRHKPTGTVLFLGELWEP